MCRTAADVASNSAISPRRGKPAWPVQAGVSWLSGTPLRAAGTAVLVSCDPSSALTVGPVSHAGAVSAGAVSVRVHCTRVRHDGMPPAHFRQIPALRVVLGGWGRSA